MAKAKKELKESTLLQRVAPDPSQPADLPIVVKGYLGKSPKAGYWKLYLNANMNDCLEVAEDDIIDSQSQESDDNPFAGTILWIKKDANILYSHTEKLKAQASFLGGDVANSMLSAGMARGINTGPQEVLPTPAATAAIQAFALTPYKTIVDFTLAVCVPFSMEFCRTWVTQCPIFSGGLACLTNFCRPF